MPSSEVMGKWGKGKLKSGGGGTVPHTAAGQKQALAIMYSERKNVAEHGGTYESKSEPAHVKGMRNARKPKK